MKYLFRVEIISIGNCIIWGSIITSVPPSDKGFITLHGKGDTQLVIEVQSISPIANADQDVVYKAAVKGQKGVGVEFLYDGTIRATVQMIKLPEALEFFRQNNWSRSDKASAEKVVV